MFRINFYKNYEVHRRERIRTRAQQRVGSAILALSVLMFGTQILSGLLVRDQAAMLGESLPALESRLQEKASVAEDLKAARQLLKVRARRLDWSPKLAALSESLDEALVLDAIDGHAGMRGMAAGFSVAGRARGAFTTLDAISDYAESLRGEARITADFPEATIETVKNEGGEFEIRCLTEGGK